MGVTIRAADKRAATALERLNRYKEADDGIDQGSARVLYAAYQGTLSATDMTTDRMLKVGALVNRGAVTVGTGIGSRVQLTQEAAYAFDMSH